MSMRYITVPASTTITDQRVNQQTSQVEVLGTKSYSYFDLLREFVWNRPEWRKDEVHANTFNRLYDAHEEAEAKKLPVVPMTQEDYALFQPFATLKDIQIGGPNVAKLNRLTQCVTFASSTKPESLLKIEQAQASASNGGS